MLITMHNVNNVSMYDYSGDKLLVSILLHLKSIFFYIIIINFKIDTCNLKILTGSGGVLNTSFCVAVICWDLCSSSSSASSSMLSVGATCLGAKTSGACSGAFCRCISLVAVSPVAEL